MTTQVSVLKEIHNLNLSYLLLAQRVATEDAKQAESFLNMDIELIQTVKQLTATQILALAQTNQCIIKVKPNLITPLAEPTGAQAIHGQSQRRR
ncbi:MULTISPECIES: flagellar transcriptional regulator FlhD [Enterobacteriaceae]|jgi:flagellar transcriptional activator FlhD|uniref:flagellar transcriptional regulator FlhD n=1 Tax=Enterobacteriaceae TaxID=543 RepID=UPI0006923E15|nr:flagellar transcriptional regulator FlhD [Citrobacter sp. BDA59-3]MDU4997109.1 flagellar transcriptional regulator FlhD [Enterobacteriaceae bacterium]PXW51012.1 flagellar transcriptional activator FlhD [Grimontella sp. AG753]QOV66759.1 flagellar transcriptional regulator FlhD [Citrobacter sp. BDA59-3]